MLLICIPHFEEGVALAVEQLLEINLSTESCHQCSTFSGTSLNSIERPQLIDLVRSYKDSFIRSYDEMFDLSQDIGVHLLKVKRDSP